MPNQIFNKRGITILFFIIFSLILGYLVGSIFISYPWGLIKGIDITKSGTGQLGGSNAGRLLGWYVMVISGLFDVLKATTTLLLIDYVNKKIILEQVNLDRELSLIAGSIGLLLGHIYSLYVKLISRKWQGGKGTAPYGGILLFISWPSFIVVYAVLFGILQLIKRVIKSSLTIYDNFMTNAILLLVSPFIVIIFSPEIWIFIWLVILIFILLLSERKKVVLMFKSN